ncbi:unnamed protein product [Acanthoscelides obtectus]|uniref:RING-type E3 ubiquitin transferase n=1 Tax=Acanthoscelides obtectus TaxID=200917 RepID=A0A9P0NVW3_ACAOB|nr:unnamed protein product [Acanthoscelides obtectus]CAK1658139.1 E3 ubiquitin-protein ligase sina [Acanthoscelides obtectus]
MAEFNNINILQIKCEQCKFPCSVAPVSKESGNFVCGRCYPGGAPNEAYEEAAEEALFPCGFGCPDIIPWGQVPSHEAVCKGRTVICPFANCTSSAALKDLVDHINEAHALFLQRSHKVNEIYLGLMDEIIRLHCIQYGKFTFLFFIKFEGLLNNQELYEVSYSIHLVWPQNFERTELEALQCSLELQIPNSYVKLTRLIQGTDIQLYHDKQHCVNCAYGKCKKPSHENRFKWPLVGVPINTCDSLEKPVFYTINVHKERLNAVIITPRDLECPVCFEYMTENILLCEQGHSTCTKCISPPPCTIARVAKCQICRASFGASRNYQLESLIKSMKILCRWHVNGCMFAELVKVVKEHEAGCPYDPESKNSTEL